VTVSKVIFRCLPSKVTKYGPLLAELTFIVLARLPPDEGSLSDDELKALPMVGDVNLFFKGRPDDEDFEVEVEVMIAGLALFALPLRYLHSDTRLFDLQKNSTAVSILLTKQSACSSLT